MVLGVIAGKYLIDENEEAARQFNSALQKLHAPPPSRMQLKILRATVSVVYPPRTVIRLHHHPVQGRIRLYCPLLVPAGSTSLLHFPGRDTHDMLGGADSCSWFDESFEHTLLYEGNAPRAALLVDVVHPAFYFPGAEALKVDLQPAPLDRLYWQDIFSQAAGKVATNTIAETYNAMCAEKSDINEHLPVLKELARSVGSVVEMGVRDGISTWAFLQGLVESEASGKFLTGVDIVDLENSSYKNPMLLGALRDVNVTFVRGNSVEVRVPRRDLLFLDTWHVYGHLRRELDAHHTDTNRYIVLHDTQTFADRGESWYEDQRRDSGYSPEDLALGLLPAIEAFLAEHPEWFIGWHLLNNNGLIVLARS
eukprot:gnl/TRDRNA2_/TRDRNA2_156457_c1_seq1.p1 gnl/TRDRNA2_/TRDRNA2_156457_c1~~gnl/TRDRNA2_/TRDRNA2_156457_c1_seq1.p1  ORF type:complete len:388 (-),score=55.01 gnl/TRDRNA2_/TRDRNA2_156457_c1_seq1:52-1149(-)